MTVLVFITYFINAQSLFIKFMFAVKLGCSFTETVSYRKSEDEHNFKVIARKYTQLSQICVQNEV